MSNRDDARAIADKGTEALYQKRYDDAIEWAKKALEIDAQCDQAQKVWGLGLFFKGQEDEGIEHLYLSVKYNPKYATGWYNLACVHSKRKEKGMMLAALAQAVLWGKKEYCMDYRKNAMEDADFDNFRTDKDFLELVFPVPPELKELYLAVWDNEGDKILGLGEKLVKSRKVKDKLAVLEAMRYGAEIIVSDLEEHGKANLSLYQHEDQRYYEDLLKDITARIGAARKKGQKSDVWLKFKGKEDEGDDLADLKSALNCIMKKSGN